MEIGKLAEWRGREISLRRSKSLRSAAARGDWRWACTCRHSGSQSRGGTVALFWSREVCQSADTSVFRGARKGRERL